MADATKTVNGSLGLIQLAGFVVLIFAVYQGIESSSDRMQIQLNHLREDLVKESMQLDARSASRKETLDEIITRIEHSIDMIAEELRERSATSTLAISKLAAFETQLTEVETQFRGVRDIHSLTQVHTERRLAQIEGWNVKHDAEVRGLNAAQWERIRSIEQLLTAVWKKLFPTMPLSPRSNGAGSEGEAG